MAYYTKNLKVTTKDGIKQIKELNVGDEILTFGPEYYKVVDIDKNIYKDTYLLSIFHNGLFEKIRLAADTRVAVAKKDKDGEYILDKFMTVEELKSKYADRMDQIEAINEREAEDEGLLKVILYDIASDEGYAVWLTYVGDPLFTITYGIETENGYAIAVNGLLTK